MVAAWIWTISWHGGLVQTAGTVRESRAARAPSSLGDYMFEIHHINDEENMLISGTREKSAVGDSAEPKQ